MSKIHSSGYFVGREPQTRTPLVVAQWTDQRTSRVAGELVKDLVMRLGDVSDREIIVAPSSIGLGPALESARGTRIGIGAQNLSSQPKADSPWNAASQALSDVGVKAVVLGHSSARQVLGETDATVALKVRTVLDHGLSPILCVGERDQKCLTKWWLYKQVSLAIAAVRPEEVHRLAVAHEPAWEPPSQSSGHSGTVQEAAAFIRACVMAIMGARAAASVRILCAWGVGPHNVDAIMSQPDIDGVVVKGRAATEPESFLRIASFGRPYVL